MLGRRLAVLWLLTAARAAQAQGIELSLDTIRHPAFEADGISAHLNLGRNDEVELRVARLKFGETEYRDVALTCAGFRIHDGSIDCPRGRFRRASQRNERPELPFSLSYRPRDGHLEFAIAGIDAIALSPLFKRLRAWQPEGRIDLKLIADRQRADFRLAARGLAFSNKAGDITGKGLALDIDARAERNAAGWHWQASAAWPGGEIYRHPWRRKAGVNMRAEGQLTEERLDIALARLEVAGIGAVTAGLDWNRQRGEPSAWGFVTERLDLAKAMEEWIQPWLNGLGFPAWQTSGSALFAADWRAGQLQRFYAGLEEASLADGTGYLRLNGVTAQIPWQADTATQASFGIASGQLGDLPLGGFSFPLQIADGTARVSKLTAPLLDGQLVIDDLRVNRTEAGWNGEFEGGIEGVSMPKLSRALKLPVMAGSLTARVPRIAFDNNVLALDGALSIEVFDGGLIVHHLRLVDPFGAGRRFLADVTARGLDLGMLTRTFSWGAIAGRFDADLHDLEMVGWKPVSFVARISDSPGDFERTISIGALRDIAALGADRSRETTAQIAIRDGFGLGYQHIAFGCALKNGVCLLDGVAREGEGVVLVEGRGIPTVRIIGYNRRIDWEALVARIREVIAGKPGVVIQ